MKIFLNQIFGRLESILVRQATSTASVWGLENFYHPLAPRTLTPNPFKNPYTAKAFNTNRFKNPRRLFQPLTLNTAEALKTP